MISRRSFLKLSGLGLGALGAGFGTGHALSARDGHRFSIHGFVPDDDMAVTDLLRIFRAELPSSASASLIDADPRWQGVVQRALGQNTLSSGPFEKAGRMTIRIQRLGHPINGDVLVSDDRKRIYNPEGDFSMALHGLRRRLQSSEAQYMISADYVGEAPFAGLLSTGNMLVVENTDGVIDRIALDGRSRQLDVRGPQGRTGVTIGSHGAHVHSATCRHEVCRKAGSVSRPGDVIACAPNRVLLRIERA